MGRGGEGRREEERRGARRGEERRGEERSEGRRGEEGGEETTHPSSSV